MKKTGKFMIFLFIVLLLLLYISQHIRVESFVIGQLRQRSKETDNSGTCSPTNCDKNSLKNLTSQCSFISNSDSCGKSYVSSSNGKIPCSWINGVYDPINKTCGKNPNSAGGVCGTCF